MKQTTKIALLALIAAIAITAATAASASASPEWYVKKSGAFKKLTGTEAVKVAMENTFEIIDQPEFGISCKGGEGTGEVKAGGKATVGTFRVTGSQCIPAKTKGPNQCKEFRTFAAGNLAWATELYTEGTEIRQRYPSGARQAFVQFGCTGITDECDFAASTHMANNLTGGLVEATFDAKTGKVQCLYSNGQNGEWKGVLKIKPTSEEKAKGVEAIKVE